MVLNTDISIAISIIDFIPAPHHIIISGPSDTFGNELRTVRYGSRILAIFLFHHINVATRIPIVVASIKLIIVSEKVINMWVNRLLSLYKFIIVFIMSEGDENRKVFISLCFVNSSQIIISIVIMNSLKNLIMYLSFFSFFK